MLVLRYRLFLNSTNIKELRYADYAQGRRYGTGGAFGTPSTFGGTSTGTPGAFGGFGTTATTTGTPGAFGQPAQPTTTGGFGSGAFGSTNTAAGGFGTTTTSAFGQNTPQASGFGTGTTGFGTGTTGAFGSGTTGGFGQPTGTGAFGTSKPAFGLGAFGSNTTGATNTGFGSGPGTSAFGTPASTAGGFGTTTSTPQTNTWSGFGSGTQQQPGGFGQTATNQENKPAGFGGFGTSTPTPATNTFSGFGQKPAGSGFTGFGTGTGGFGSNTSTGGLGFGNTPSAPGSTGTGLGGFGGGSTNTPGFGSGSSFFNKPATSTFTLGGSGGLGGTTGTIGSTFTSGSTGPFGGGTGFGLGNQNQNTGGGLFSTPQAQQTNAQLQQSIMSSPYGSNPLFQMGGTSSYGGDVSKPIAPIATLIPKEGKDDKNPAILAGFRLTPSGGKSRFSLGGSASPLGGSPFSRRKRDVLGLGTPTKILLNATPSSSSGIELTPEAFVVPKKGLKTLEISRSKRDLNITGGGDIKGIEAAPADGSLVGTSSKSSNVDPRLEKEAREKERQRIDHETRKKSNIEESKKKPFDTNGPSKPKEPDELIPAQQRKATPPVSIVSTSTDKTFDFTAEDEGTYWTIPSMSTILSSRDVRAVQNFVVGRKGYGQVRFSQPVDLSQVRSIPDIPGTIVVFDLKICTVYPDEAIKPPVGRGLNVPATITLEKCWPVSKETRRPIVDVENPRFIAHVERLKRQPETEFIDYIADTGSWIFKVKHFSSYACPGDADNWSTIYEEPIPAPSATVPNIDDLTVGDSVPNFRCRFGELERELS